MSPFDAAAVVLTVGGAIIAATWTENYGSGSSDAAEGASSLEGFKKAGQLIWSGVFSLHLHGLAAGGRPGVSHRAVPARRPAHPHAPRRLSAPHRLTPPRPCRAQDCAAGRDAVALRGLHVHLCLPVDPRAQVRLLPACHCLLLPAAGMLETPCTLGCSTPACCGAKICRCAFTLAASPHASPNKPPPAPARPAAPTARRSRTA